MRVFKRGKAETYSYDFRCQGVRYCGNTGCTSKREAEGYVRELKRIAKLQSKTRPAEKSLTIKDAAARYWHEIGQHHKAADTTLTDLERLITRLGETARLKDIDSERVAHLVAQRRGDGVANGTVNRGTTKLLRALLNRAQTTWNQKLDPINWRAHLLPEPKERIREMTLEEQRKIIGAVRPDYAPLFEFRWLTGCRLQECLDLKWRHIDWHNREFTVTGKGNKSRVIPMTTRCATLLKALPRAHERVFTKMVYRTTTGEREPITSNAVKHYQRRLFRQLGIENFRGHDFRHTAATRLVRQTGNLKLAQHLLGHESITTTARYAHATRADLAAGMDAVEKADAKSHAKSHATSRRVKNN